RERSRFVYQATAYAAEGSKLWSCAFHQAPDVFVQRPGQLKPQLQYVIHTVQLLPTGLFLTVERQLATGALYVRQRQGRTGQLIPNAQWELPLEAGEYFNLRLLRNGNVLIEGRQVYLADDTIQAAMRLPKADQERRPKLPDDEVWQLDQAGKKL